MLLYHFSPQFKAFCRSPADECCSLWLYLHLTQMTALLHRICKRIWQCLKTNIQNQLYIITKSPHPSRCLPPDYKRQILFGNLLHLIDTATWSVKSRRGPWKPCAVMRHPANIWITAVDRGEGGGISFPRQRWGNWDIIQTNSPLTQASVCVYVGEVRVSIPFQFTSVIYPLPKMGRGYLDQSHEDRTNIQYMDKQVHYTRSISRDGEQLDILYQYCTHEAHCIILVVCKKHIPPQKYQSIIVNIFFYLTHVDF